MTDALVLAVTGQNDLAAAWKTLVKPDDRVGIKICATGGRFFSSHKSIIDALASGLAQAGVPPQNILVWDRADLANAGFSETSSRYTVATVAPIIGYDVKSGVTAPIEGQLIWGDALFINRHNRNDALLNVASEREQFSSESHWSKPLCAVTKIINVPVLSSSEHCGVAGCFYNATIPNIDNWRRFLTEPLYLVDLFHDEHVAPKIVLNILDGITAQFAGGPDWQPNYAWHHGVIYASKDPVALDAIALRQIETKRAEVKLPSLVKHASFLEAAESMGLGKTDAECVEVKTK